MKEKLSKILGLFLFAILIFCISYLVFSSNTKTNKGAIKMIEITGNRLLPVSEYLTFTKLDDSSQYYNLNLSMIKERFEKHPYIEKVDVEDLGNQKVKVYLTEKKLEARLLLNGESKFISDKFQVLPILSVAKMVDLPIISNMNINQNVNSLSILKNDEMVQAFKIIDAAKLTNEDLYEKLSEINLQDGGDIHLTLSGIRPTVYFGIGEAAKKMVYLDLMLNGMSNSNSLVDSSEYIDLRFANEIYLGSAEKIGLSE